MITNTVEDLILYRNNFLSTEDVESLKKEELLEDEYEFTEPKIILVKDGYGDYVEILDGNLILKKFTGKALEIIVKALNSSLNSVTAVRSVDF